MQPGRPAPMHSCTSLHAQPALSEHVESLAPHPCRFLFIGSCVLDVLDLRKQGGSATAPAAAAAPAPGGKGEEKEAPAEPAAPASAAPSSVSEEAQAAAVPPEVATAV